MADAWRAQRRALSSLPDSFRKFGKLSMASLCNFNTLASWRNAENALQSVNLTIPPRRRHPRRCSPSSRTLDRAYLSLHQYACDEDARRNDRRRKARNARRTHQRSPRAARIAPRQPLKMNATRTTSVPNLRLEAEWDSGVSPSPWRLLFPPATTTPPAVQRRTVLTCIQTSS